MRALSYPIASAHSVTQLELSFRIPDSMPPEALAGIVEIDGYTLRAARLAGKVSVEVSGQVEPVGDVRFDPSTVVMQVVRSCVVISCETKPHAVIHLYGADVGQLLARLGEHGELHGAVTRGARSVPITLEELKRDPLEVDAATARVQLNHAPGAGTYSGVLPLSHLRADSPALDIQVHSEQWVGWALLSILAGVLASGWAFQRYPRVRRRRLISQAVKREIDDLLVACGKLPANLQSSPLITEVTKHVDLAHEYDWRYYSKVSASDPVSIVAGARWARDEADFAEATRAARGLVDRLELWRRGLDELSALVAELGRAGGRRTGVARTPVGTAARELVDEIVSGPLTRLDDPALAEQLLHQTQWYRRFSTAWELRAVLALVDGPVASEARAVNLISLSERAEPVWRAPAEQRQGFERTLERLTKRLEALRRQTNIDRIVIHPPAAESEAQVVRVPSTSSDVFEKDPLLGLTLAAERAGPVVDPPPAWEEGASNEVQATNATPPSAVRQPSAARRLARLGHASGTHERKRALRARVLEKWRRSRLLLRLHVTDLFVSAAILLASAVVYSVTLYNDEWGTLGDVITAFGAGFLGNVVVSWGLVPIFQTIRLPERSPTTKSS